VEKRNFQKRRSLYSKQAWCSGSAAGIRQEMKAMLDRQLLAGQSLTAREGQVLQLLFRRLTNKRLPTS